MTLLFLVLVATAPLVGATGCGVDTAGLVLFSDSGAAGPSTAASVPPADGGTITDDGDAAATDFGLFGMGVLAAPTDASGPDVRDVSSPGLDAGPPPPPPPADAGADAHVETGGGLAACDHLMQCCGRLIIAPPLAAACYVTVQQADGGDGGSCAANLALLQDSGACP